MAKYLLALLLVALPGGLRAQYPGPGSLPGQPRMCLGSLEKGKIRLRHLFGSKPIPLTHQIKVPRPGGQPGETESQTIQVTRIHLSELVIELDARAIKAQNTDGQEISPARLAELLRGDAPVLVFDRGQQPSEKLLQVIRKEIPVLVLPIPFEGQGYGAPLMPAPVPPGAIPIPREAPPPPRP